MTYKQSWLDADTPVLRAALSVQNNFVTVKHMPSGREMRFDNQTKFFGHWKSKNGGWLKQRNEKRVSKGLPPFSVDEFEIQESSELNPSIGNHIEKAVEQFDFFVGRIKKLNFAEEYVLGVGGSGNFRYDLAQILPYKGERKEKPLVFYEVKEAIIRKYSKHVVLANDQEVDDVLGIEGFRNYKKWLKTGKWDSVLGFCDKDLQQIISPQFNYLDDNPKVFIPTPEDAARALCVQLLAGDKGTDNIPGLPSLTDEVRQKYSLGKTRGIGKATALSYLEGCKDIKEMFERVVEAYRSFYGVGKQEFKTHRGDVLQWNWIDYLQDNAQLLWLRREDGEMYDIRKTLDRLGIDYD